jgi:hypothetical protein
MSSRRHFFHWVNTFFVLCLSVGSVALLFITPSSQAVFTGIFATIFLATFLGIWSLAEGLSLDG